MPGCMLEGRQLLRELSKKAMFASEENKTVIRRWLGEVFSSGDLDGADELFTLNYALHDPSFPRDVHGPEGIKRYVTAYRVAFPDLEVVVEDQLKKTKLSPAGRRGERTRASSWGWHPPATR